MPTRRQLLLAASLLPITSIARPEASTLKPSRIIKKPIPSSGEEIPVIGIGTNRFDVGDDREALAMLKATLKHFAQMGGGMIDTAPSYRGSERVIGQLIDELGLADAFFMGTKCDEQGGNATLEQLASSKAKLMSGKLDLVSVHNLRNWQKQLPVLRDAKAAGEIRYLGITTWRGRQHEEFEAVMESEKLDFVQVSYSLANRKIEDRILKIAADKGIAVVVNLAFARGQLFSQVKDKALPSWAAEFDANSWGQFFLKYVVSHPSVTCAIPGTTKLHHLEDNLGAALGRLPTTEQRADMEKLFDAF